MPHGKKVKKSQRKSMHKKKIKKKKNRLSQ